MQCTVAVLINHNQYVMGGSRYERHWRMSQGYQSTAVWRKTDTILLGMIWLLLLFKKIPKEKKKKRVFGFFSWIIAATLSKIANKSQVRS